MADLGPIAVLGAGSWGTALAIQLARMGQPVRLWGNEPEHIKTMQEQRCNVAYLPDVKLPESLQPFNDVAEALENVRDIVMVVPSHAFRAVLNDIKPLLSKDVRIAWGSKGLDDTANQLLDKTVIEVIGQVPMAALSGPSFAKETAADKPTAVALACNDNTFSEDLSKRFHGGNFRVYPNNDLTGVQLGGVVKNIMAVAAGISDGLDLGTNARCALITRGLAEMVRLGVAMGAKAQTFMGLSGLGDLVLTCTDNQSRNRRFGLAMGEGLSVQAAQERIGQVVESVHNIKQVRKLAQLHSVSMPITEKVYDIVFGDAPAAQAVQDLLSRDAAEESLL